MDGWLEQAGPKVCDPRLLIRPGRLFHVVLPLNAWAERRETPEDSAQLDELVSITLTTAETTWVPHTLDGMASWKYERSMPTQPDHPL